MDTNEITEIEAECKSLKVKLKDANREIRRLKKLYIRHKEKNQRLREHWAKSRDAYLRTEDERLALEETLHEISEIVHGEEKRNSIIVLLQAIKKENKMIRKEREQRYLKG